MKRGVCQVGGGVPRERGGPHSTGARTSKGGATGSVLIYVSEVGSEKVGKTLEMGQLCFPGRGSGECPHSFTHSFINSFFSLRQWLRTRGPVRALWSTCPFHVNPSGRTGGFRGRHVRVCVITRYGGLGAEELSEHTHARRNDTFVSG